MNQPSTVHLLNTTIIPAGADGVYEAQTIHAEQARGIVSWALDMSNWGASEVVSHVGHESTAAIMKQILGTHVEVNRQPWDGSGMGLVLQMTGRPPEGKILSEEEMREFGFSWRLLRWTGEASGTFPSLESGKVMNLSEWCVPEWCVPETRESEVMPPAEH